MPPQRRGKPTCRFTARENPGTVRQTVAAPSRIMASNSEARCNRERAKWPRKRCRTRGSTHNRSKSPATWAVGAPASPKSMERRISCVRWRAAFTRLRTKSRTNRKDPTGSPGARATAAACCKSGAPDGSAARGGGALLGRTASASWGDGGRAVGGGAGKGAPSTVRPCGFHPGASSGRPVVGAVLGEGNVPSGPKRV